MTPIQQTAFDALLKFAIAERDCFYESCSDPAGVVTDPGDQEELRRLDSMIDRAQAAAREVA